MLGYHLYMCMIIRNLPNMDCCGLPYSLTIVPDLTLFVFHHVLYLSNMKTIQFSEYHNCEVSTVSINPS